MKKGKCACLLRRPPPRRLIIISFRSKSASKKAKSCDGRPWIRFRFHHQGKVACYNLLVIISYHTLFPAHLFFLKIIIIPCPSK